MLEALTMVLSGGPKAFFENSAYLLGIPLVALGVLGFLMVLSPVELRWPQTTVAAPPELLPAPEGHPTAAVYVRVGAFLAFVTLFEVIIYYVNLAQGALLAVLLSLSLLKFVMVVLWFMHLRFDSRIFSILFTGGLVLVLALFFVVLGTLGSSLV